MSEEKVLKQVHESAADLDVRKHLEEFRPKEQMEDQTMAVFSEEVCECKHKHRDPKEEKDLINRLNRIEGQVRGVKAMVQDERYCPDILIQVSAIQSALNSFTTRLLSSHIKSCVVADIKDGNEEAVVDELCNLIKKML